MENAEEVLHYLEEFSKRKPKIIPQELNDYLAYVARTGDPVYQWSLVKCLFKEKLLNVITDFYETSPGIDIPPCPNVDPFNYDIMKNSLLERLDTFSAAPFTVQRICELLTYPRKQYNRIDKFMRAIEKNILVVSTREPGQSRHMELENGEPLEPMVNGSDNNSDYNVDVEMEDMSWKENSERQQSIEPQPSSSETHITVDDIEARLQAKQDTPSSENQDKSTTQYESVTPPELNMTDESPEIKISNTESENKDVVEEDCTKKEDEIETSTKKVEEQNMETESKENSQPPLVIPEITVDDAEMTEQKLIKQASIESTNDKEESDTSTTITEEKVAEVETPSHIHDDNSSDSSTKEDNNEAKLISEVSTSSEESSSSSDVTDGNSNSPKPDNDNNLSNQEDLNPTENVDVRPEDAKEEPKVEDTEIKEVAENIVETPAQTLQCDNYSISDVDSELPQAQPEAKIEVEKPVNIENKAEQPVEDETKTDDDTKVTET